MNKKTTLILITLLVSASIIFSAPPSMDKNIEIMESILNKIIVEDSPIIFSYGNKFHGNYYDNFGIILDAESSGVMAFDELLDVHIEKVPFYVSHEKKEPHKVFVKKTEKDKKNSEKEQKEAVETKLNEAQTALEDFFLNYARSAMDMKNEEKILVNIKVKNNHYSSVPDVPSMIQMSANVKDLKKYYTGKLDEKKMKKLLTYETTNQENQKKDIEVMENIFDTFLEKESAVWISDDATDGFYLKGFGAVFNIPVSHSRDFMPMSINFEVLEEKIEASKAKLEETAAKLEENLKKIEEHYYDSDGKKVTKKKYKWNSDANDASDNVYVYTSDNGDEASVTVRADSIDMDVDVTVDSDGKEKVVFLRTSEFDETKIDSIMNKTKEDVIKTLSIYGSTLKSVKSDEMVNINLKMDAYKKEKSISLICPKKNIDDYTNGKIDYDKFVSRIKIK